MKLKISYCFFQLVNLKGFGYWRNTYTSLCSQHKECQQELSKHSDNDSLPLNCLAVPGSSIECANEHKKTEQAHCTICPCVVCRFCWDESAHEEDSNCSSSAKRKSELLWDHLDWVVDDLDPDKCNGLGDIFGRDIEGDEPDSKAKPDKEGNQPAQVVSVKNKSGNPLFNRNVSLILGKEE